MNNQNKNKAYKVYDIKDDDNDDNIYFGKTNMYYIGFYGWDSKYNI